jgi:predicted ATPase/class 3 adenylate cyclase
MRTDLPTGTVTFLFTDIEGSTRLLHALGPDGYAEALAEHRRVLREAFAAHGGVEVDTQGDAFFVAFPTAAGAAAAATAARDALSSGPISVRMGLHTGAPKVTGEGYVGIDVHRGARVAALAHGGQIVLSPATAALLDGRELHDLGLHRLKDFEAATRLSQLGPGEYPPLRTPGSVDLPRPATRFLGRERELFEAVSLVYERDPRVLTILGSGGTGKTRFAIELARLLAEDAEGGTVFVPLAPLRDPELVVPALADRLGAASPDVAAVAARIGDRRLHAVVDNVEHLLPDAARPLAELVAAAPALRLFVTSREALRVQGEHELDLPPLADDEAVELFCERARAVRPDVREDAAVRELCARLDQLPLALELAAARTKLLSPEALLERLGDRLDLLRGARDVDERHATLRATIAWSYDLLDADEQRLFRRLAVFRGGCTLETAEQVCAADVDAISSLLDKSLVRRRSGRLGEERIWMLETIREFAAERLRDSGEGDEVRQRHAERMLEIASATHLSEDDDEPFRLDIALAEREDLRAALDWATAHHPSLGLELAVELEGFWGTHAPEEGTRRLGELLERAVDIPLRLRARALRTRAGSAHQRAAFEVADPCYEESLRIFTELGDERSIASLWIRFASRAHERGDLDRARQFIERCRSVAEGRFPAIEAQINLFVGRFALEEGAFDDAAAYLQRSRTLASSLSWGWWEAMALTLLMEAALGRSDTADAERYGREAVGLFAAQESRTWATRALTGLAKIALARGNLDMAGALWGAAAAEGERLPAWRERRLRLGGALLTEEREAFVAAVEHGRELQLWDAVALALGELEPPQTVP